MMYDLIRSFGLVAYLSFSLSVALGIASLGGGTSVRALDRRVVRQLVHRSAAIVGLVALTAHLGLTVLDSYVPTSVGAVLVPFTAGYQVIALGIGTLATYLFVMAALSGWLRLTTARLLSERGWRWLHRSAYAGWGLCLLHSVLAGPDTGQRWATLAYAAGAMAVLAGIGVRIIGGRHLRHRELDGSFRVREVQ